MIEPDAHMLAAAERLLDQHQRVEDYELGDDGEKLYYQVCQWDDADWPCDTALVVYPLLGQDP